MRTRNTILTAALNYGQFAAASIAGLLVVPVVIRTFGPDLYGTWLAGTEAIGYVLLVDLGVTAILPWLVAQADGRGEPAKIRAYLRNAVLLTTVLAAVAIGVSCVAWGGLEHAIYADAGLKSRLAPPLLLLLVLMLVSLPLNLFVATLQGLQEVMICGVIGLGRAVAGPLLLVLAIRGGLGLYAFPIAYLVTPLGGIIALAFVTSRAELAKGAPDGAVTTSWLLREGAGPWFGTLSAQMLARSSAIILAGGANAGHAAVFACTYRVPQLLTQLAWTIPDSALVGLAQLAGEGSKTRVRDIVGLMLKAEIVLAGFVACTVLAFNGVFVRWWVGAALFGGFATNAALASDMLLSSIVHILVSAAAVQGHRLAIGLSSLLQGILFIGLSLLLVPSCGLIGITAAMLVAPWVTTLPTAIVILKRLDVFGPRQVVMLIARMVTRLLPLLLLSAGFGYFRAPVARLPEAAVALAILGVLYVLTMRAALGELAALASPLLFWRSRIATSLRAFGGFGR